MEFLGSEIVNEEVVTASLQKTYDLGVNGLSCLVVNVDALQNANNTAGTVEDMLSVIGTLSVLYNGQLIISGNGPDIIRMGSIISGVSPWFTCADQAANAEMGLTFVLPFGRKLFHPTEGFPAVSRGQLQLQLTAAASFGTVKTPHWSVTQFEIPGNKFRQFNKFTLRQNTPAATGFNDIPMPIGNTLRGIGIFATTRYRSPHATGDIKSPFLVVNNQEKYYTGGQLYSAMLWAQRRGALSPMMNPMAEITNLAGAYAQFADSDTQHVNTLEYMRQFAYLDLDPTEDDLFSLDTKGLSELSCRVDVATASEVLRFYAYESLPASKIQVT